MWTWSVMELSWMNYKAQPNTSTQVECMSHPASSGHCNPFPPPQTSLIAADSHHVSQSIDTVKATNTYLNSALCCHLSGSQGKFRGTRCRIYDWLLSMQWEIKGKKVEVQVEERNKKAEERSSPPGRFYWQQQHLKTQLRLEICLPLTLQSVQRQWKAHMKGLALQYFLIM